MRALARVGVLVEMRAVELGEAVSVTREIRGRTVAAGGSKIAESLVAPGTVEGMFHDGEQFDVRIAEVFVVRYELLAQFAVAQPSIVVFGHAAPGAGMDFVDGDW